MKVQVEKVSSIVQKLSIEVEPAVVERELSAAYGELSRQVKMPGFRPGKVPRRMLETKFKSEVEADVLRRVQLKSALEAIQTEKVPAIGEPRFSGGKLVQGSPLAFTAECDVKPEVTASNWKGLKLKRHDATVSDAAVDEQLEKLRASRATLEPVTGRDTVQMGDWVSMDFEAKADGQAFPGGSGQGVTVEVAPGELTEGNLPQLEGAVIGQPKTFDYVFPSSFRNEEMAGKTAAFTATVKEIKVRKPPELDDTFAQAVGAPTVAELKANVRADLEKAAKARIAGDERTDVLNALVEANPIEVPNSLIERGVDMLLDSAFGQMFRAGIDPRQLSLDWGRLRADMRPKSELEAKGQLLLEAIAKAENISVTDEDLEARLVSLAEESGMNVAQLKRQYDGAKGRANLKARVVEEKTVSLVRQNAQFE